jgi:integrase
VVAKAQKIATKVAAAAPDSVGEIYESYLQRHLRPKLRSAHAIDLAIRADVLPVWGDLPIGSITRAMVSTLVDAIADRQAPRSKGQGSPRAAELRLRYISGLFKWAEGMGYVEGNPAERVPKPKEKEARERVLSDNELRLIWQACDRMDPVNAPFVQLLMISAQRKSEIGGGFWSEVDLAAKTWSMPKERVKNGTAHTFPLPAGAVAILQGIERNGDKIFTGPLGGATWGSAKAKSTLDAIIAELNGGEPLEHWTLHDLRRTATTRMGDLGVAPHAIECVLGHAGGFRAGVAGTYNRSAYWPEMVDALNRWDARLKVIIADADNVIALPTRDRA